MPLTKTWQELCISINPVCADVLCDIIQSNFDCEGIITAEETYKNLEMVSTTENTLKAYIVADSLDFDEVQSFFKQKRQEIADLKIFNEDIGSWDVKITKQDNTDWSKKWKESWHPSKISNRIVICPSWEEYTPKTDEIKVILDPGNAFGTGTHATTQLCIKAFERYGNDGDIVADVGCGSGILGICALKEGAMECNAVDTDDTAVETAQINAGINDIKSISFETASSEVLATKKYDFVFANILHNVLAQIMPDLKRIMKIGGKAVLSGILDGKEPVVISACKNNNIKIVEEMRQSEWIAFVVERID